MALRLYRREECEGGHAEDSKSGQFEEDRRGWNPCACLIHVCGTLAGKFKRCPTEKWKWEEAIQVAAGWESFRAAR